ncbi:MULTISPECIES: LysR family transcriptional regulator [unclassified Paenibacillus]|uniref:LysR family transcriptional regulator n=1 Tax=unclassified Paenibacillus TaxID=185978 RepID=UPI0024067F3F|nr:MULTISPECIES: LysR family transcriptional regulator [unclassified Paenibacillus]MDF9839207.1 DNA-binding transcriptional LysR family regulator [Paenibacillus sp. PastF-2]MDF9845788.1 DNA-binding transcriptional LysR family regulator [Paenibacillus sp. PastM-2]MDF9852361.1 DNA-binding transcriptional LysR family regulator [Paenibacillus sp. PastF-1]MDH6477909.1 DNA-binding transcriptional LysR family regulator [Paenibacillus sp. PastH-2]MDH6505648.1 DNA-binding transcriptional LysR family re
MTLQQLRYAIEIANSGSMNEAAKRLFVSQPSLSNAIKELENELGIIIFERTNRGISISAEGMEFLGYARQIIEQTEFMENRYTGKKRSPVYFSVSTQHYAFVVDAFVRLMKERELAEYNFSLRETQTFEIIEDVRTLRSDLGILYINESNYKVMNKLFSDGNLKFTPLFNTNPHVYVRMGHTLAGKESIILEDILPFPYITFEQGDNNSLHFSEEMLSFTQIEKNIKVTDRATLSNLLLGSDAYTIGTGIMASDLNGNGVVTIPYESNEVFTVGWIAHKDRKPSDIMSAYIDLLNDLVASSYFDMNQFLL